MTIRTSDFPQADRLIQVGMVATAVSKGKHTDEEIEDFIGLGSLGRQGRYYRLAAEILGLIINESNHAILTDVGREFATLSNPSSQMEFLGRCLIETRVFHEGLKYINKYSPNDKKLKLWFRNFYPGAETTANRRFSTFLNYINEAKLVEKVKGEHKLGKYSGGTLKINSYKHLHGSAMHKNIKPRLPSVVENITYNVSALKRERANKIHWELVAAKSQHLHSLGFQPYENEQIDLYVNNDKEVILYEMKSLNQESSNFIAQTRKAVSQLYEYRYIFNLPHANLCIVTNGSILDKNNWYLEYLTQDRSIAYEWTRDFVNFNTDDKSKVILGAFF
ncbi:MAG: hypothetical protein L3J51_10610 [Cocleimonas sp.]|nr:hypothetical protein [Cocleimonas sp.]